jgi:hypothetical protein
MARPKKKKALLLDKPLRIMMTAEQKRLVERAGLASGQEMSTWARTVILKEAGKVTGTNGERGS